MVIADPDVTIDNPYLGGAFQQATSGVTETSEGRSTVTRKQTLNVVFFMLQDQGCYELTHNCFSIYGFEYQPGKNDYFYRYNR